MKKIYLFCMAGLSTGVLVKKMEEAAKNSGFDCEIKAFSVNEAAKYGPEADVVLIGPQVRYQLNAVQKTLPGKPISVINMTDYGTLNGKKVLEDARKLIKD